MHLVFGDDPATDSPSSYFRADVAPLLVMLGSVDLRALRDQVPPAIATLEALGAPVEFQVLPGKSHDHVVLDFDTDADPMTPLLVDFVERVTQ